MFKSLKISFCNLTLLGQEEYYATLFNTFKTDLRTTTYIFWCTNYLTDHCDTNNGLKN